MGRQQPDHGPPPGAHTMPPKIHFSQLLTFDQLYIYIDSHHRSLFKRFRYSLNVFIVPIPPVYSLCVIYIESFKLIFLIELLSYIDIDPYSLTIAAASFKSILNVLDTPEEFW